MPASVLVIEDDQTLNKNICKYLSRYGFNVESAFTGNSGLSKVESYKPDIALCDFNLPDVSGIEVLKQIKSVDNSITVIIMTGAGSERIAVDAMKAGAHDYLAKPLILKELKILLEKTVKNQKNENILNYYQERTASDNGISKIIGDSSEMVSLRKKISHFCQAEYELDDLQAPTVLITGETGCGKELVAKAFHFDGPRRAQPFIEINCASIPGHLLEAELFGYERGAFTDAKQRKIGLVDAANGGTLFLDEIGEMELGLQAKLLTLLENRRIRRLGNVNEHEVNVRIIAATNQDLELKIKEGLFRNDLFYRLKVIHLHMPPLRERGNDIRLLADLFLQNHAKRYRKQGLQFTPKSYKKLLAYHWPGNIRELKNTLEQAVLLCHSDVIQPEDLMIQLPSTEIQSEHELLPDNDSINLQENEIVLIKKALERTGGNISRAASLLGLTRDTLRYRISKYAIQVD